MLGICRLNPGYTTIGQSTANLATNLLAASALAVIVCSLFSTPTYAQGSLPLGSVVLTGVAAQCNPSDGWYSYINSGTTYYMECQLADISCPNTQSISYTFGYLNPAGIVPGVSQAKGVIVLFNGSGGTAPGNLGYASQYFTAGYEVVELEWDGDWEQTYNPFPNGTYGNIQNANAACRPATFLNYVYTTIFPAVSREYSAAGMCAHGVSAGSAQIAYSLAYYGAGSYLDNVELLSGPVFGDVEQGCQWGPQAPQVTVCGQSNYHGGQYGCQLGAGGSTWSLYPTYLTGANTSVGKWTNDLSCADANGTTTSTSSASQSRWLAQSIVDQEATTGLGATPSFDYPSTGVSAWLCRSVQSGTGSPNNSSPQGQIFYANIGSSNSPPNYAVYAVDNCNGSEGVDTGNVPGFDPAYFGGTIQGSDAIVDDMIGYSPALLTPQCTHRSH